MRTTRAERLILENQVTIMAALNELLHLDRVSERDNSRMAIARACSRTTTELQQAKEWNEE